MSFIPVVHTNPDDAILQMTRTDCVYPSCTAMRSCDITKVKYQQENHHRPTTMSTTTSISATVSATTISKSHPRRRIVVLQESVGDYGLALFSPLLDLEIRCENMDEPYSVPILSIDPVTKKTISSLTINTEPEFDQYHSEDDDDDDEEDICVQIVAEPIHQLEACHRILSEQHVSQLSKHLPYPLRDHLWERCFAIGLHGDSFRSFLQKCAPYKYTVIVIRTVLGEILGGFATERWCVREQDRHAYYGTGQSFLFASHPATSDVKSMATANDNTEESASLLDVYKWTGSNDYCQICDSEKRILCMGGDGDFGWIVADDFTVGQTGSCETFGNPPLASSTTVPIADFEVYGLMGPWLQYSNPSGHSTSTSSTLSLSSF